ASPPATATELRVQIESAVRQHRDVLAAVHADPALAPHGSPHYFRNSLRVQRITAFFAQVREAVQGWPARGALASHEERAARRVVRELEDEVYATTIQFDDNKTGTYHSYRQDNPFVHYLETMLESLPVEGTEAFALLPAEAQHSVRRQRDQARNH